MNWEAKAQIDEIGSLDDINNLHSDHLQTTRLVTDESELVI